MKNNDKSIKRFDRETLIEDSRSLFRLSKLDDNSMKLYDSSNILKQARALIKVCEDERTVRKVDPSSFNVSSRIEGLDTFLIPHYDSDRSLSCIQKKEAGSVVSKSQTEKTISSATYSGSASFSDLLKKAQEFVRVREETGSKVQHENLYSGDDPVVRICKDFGLSDKDSHVVVGLANVFDTDVYLIDASSSMGGDSWRVISKYEFQKGASLYAFNSNFGLKAISRYSAVEPDGSTPLWDSLEELLSLSTRTDEKVCVLTDGEDNESSSTSDDVIEIARQRVIKISIVGINVGREYGSILERIARKTGGRWYIKNG